jgi:two-component system sensor histidine kinase KdpD
VIGYLETYGRRDTDAQLKDLEIVPRRRIDYRGVVMEEMDVEAIIDRRPQVCLVDELAHSNVPGSRHAKRYEDVLEILDAGIHVMTAVNIQHLETLNDAVARATGVRVRETVPDTFLDRADEVINVDVTVEELRNRLREGKIYRPEKVEQALANFFRKGNLSTLRELALRAVADEVGEKAASYRVQEGLEPALIPERVMVCMSSNTLAPRVIRTGARIAGRLAQPGTPCTSRRRGNGRTGSPPTMRRPCSRTSGWPRASGRQWSRCGRTGHQTGSSPSLSGKA